MDQIDQVDVKKTSKKKMCIVCGVKLKAFERGGLCSCGFDLCIRHSTRTYHGCVDNRVQETLEKVVASKVDGILRLINYLYQNFFLFNDTMVST